MSFRFQQERHGKKTGTGQEKVFFGRGGGDDGKVVHPERWLTGQPHVLAALIAKGALIMQLTGPRSLSASPAYDARNQWAEKRKKKKIK